MLVNQLLEGENIAKLCDYSFGDQAGVVCNVLNQNFKPILNNYEFIDKMMLIKPHREYMTLFIDNIRVYDLIEYIKEFKMMKFIIFCMLEDTPIIEGGERVLLQNDGSYKSEKIGKIEIPDNIYIFAANAIGFRERLNVFPYGVQRPLWAFDNRKEILTDFINLKLTPNFNKLVYMNYNQATNFEKRSFHLNFIDKPFATVIMDRIDYSDFLNNILNHLYVVCPEGRAIDCHRNWETIYMRRIPIMEWNKYYEELYKDIPVLFIDNFENINKNFLEDNIDKSIEKIKSFDYESLTVDNYMNMAIKKYISI